MGQEDYNQSEAFPPCPYCGAPGESRETSYFISNHMNIGSKKHKFAGSELTPLVCTQCGYVQLFTNPEDFRE